MFEFDMSKLSTYKLIKRTESSDEQNEIAITVPIVLSVARSSYYWGNKKMHQRLFISNELFM